MKVTIEIECDTALELCNHLSVLRVQIRKETKRQELDMRKQPLPFKCVLEDDNCYGWHELIVDGE